MKDVLHSSKTNRFSIYIKQTLKSKVLLHLSHYKILLLLLVTQSCLTLCDPTDRSPPGSSVHGILQARILEWAAISFSIILAPS